MLCLSRCPFAADSTKPLGSSIAVDIPTASFFFGRHNLPCLSHAGHTPISIMDPRWRLGLTSRCVSDVTTGRSNYVDGCQVGLMLGPRSPQDDKISSSRAEIAFFLRSYHFACHALRPWPTIGLAQTDRPSRQHGGSVCTDGNRYRSSATLRGPLSNGNGMSRRSLLHGICALPWELYTAARACACEAFSCRIIRTLQAVAEHQSPLA